MKIFFKISFLVVFLILISFISINFFSSIIFSPEKNSTQEIANPKVEDVFFADWHKPYSANLETSQLINIWNEVKKLPGENIAGDNQDSDWVCIGPYGNYVNYVNPNTIFSGRVRDVRFGSDNKIYVGAASGGLWEIDSNSYNPISETVTSQNTGSFDFQPGNQNLIILGTGEPFRRSGTGLWRTTDKGQTWNHISMAGDNPSSFYKIRFANSNTVHAATKSGYYRSDDAGLTWTKFMSGEISDVAINSQNPEIVYCGYWDNSSGNGGVYKSTNSGTNWTRLTGQIPSGNNVGRVLISIFAGNPEILYVMMTNDDDNTFKGIYKTANGGVNWANVSPNNDIVDGIGWYVSSLGVSPINPNMIFAGGLWLWKSSTGGATWSKIEFADNPNIHVDQHVVVWKQDGSEVCIGHDGGISLSSDNGVTFSTAKNKLPVTQFFGFSINPKDHKKIAGASQDNALLITTNGGTEWKFTIFGGGGDGSNTAYNSYDTSYLYGIFGILGGPISFGRFVSSNSGLTWTAINAGLEPSQQYNPKIRTDRFSPSFVYTNSNLHIYRSTNHGTNWSVLNTTAFPVNVNNFSVTTYRKISHMYVCLNSADAGKRLRLKIGDNEFAEVSNTLPAGISVRNVIMHRDNFKIAYAMINGLSAGNKVFKTTDRGNNWVNISGNLPNVPVSDLVTFDKNDNILYLGTEMGCYKTMNGGENWFLWNSGMPDANIITEMSSYRNSNGKFVVAAASYGRSIWERVETLNLAFSNFDVPDNYELKQNFPNPFNPSTIIGFVLPSQSLVKLKIYDITGREVGTLVNEELEAGEYEFQFNASNLSSGVYFYTLQTPDFKETKRMIYVR